MSAKIFVGGLGVTTRASDVRARFEEFGSVLQVVLVTDPVTGHGRGFGFVTFASEAEAANALREARGAGVDGHEIVVAAPGSRTETEAR